MACCTTTPVQQNKQCFVAFIGANTEKKSLQDIALMTHGTRCIPVGYVFLLIIKGTTFIHYIHPLTMMYTLSNLYISVRIILLYISNSAVYGNDIYLCVPHRRVNN